LTVLRKPIFAVTLSLSLLGGTGIAIAAPILDDMRQVVVSEPSAIEIDATDDADRIEQRSVITSVEQIALAERRAQVSDFIAFTAAGKIFGLQPSRYTGAFYRPELENLRACVVKRESGGRYSVVSSGGRYFGAYQMSKELGIGATWMMLPEHKELLGADVAKTLLADLRKTPVHKWSRYWQDAAFSTVHNWERNSSGAHHWRGVRVPC
jgi:hypothetical protein